MQYAPKFTDSEAGPSNTRSTPDEVELNALSLQSHTETIRITHRAPYDLLVHLPLEDGSAIFQVSSGVLISASAYWKRLLGPEGRKFAPLKLKHDPASGKELPFLTLQGALDLEATEYFFRILHHQGTAVPREIFFHQLLDIALLVDQFQCRGALEIYAEKWIPLLVEWEVFDDEYKKSEKKKMENDSGSERSDDIPNGEDWDSDDSSVIRYRARVRRRTEEVARKKKEEEDREKKEGCRPAWLFVAKVFNGIGGSEEVALKHLRRLLHYSRIDSKVDGEVWKMKTWVPNIQCGLSRQRLVWRNLETLFIPLQFMKLAIKYRRMFLETVVLPIYRFLQTTLYGQIFANSATHPGIKTPTGTSETVGPEACLPSDFGLFQAYVCDQQECRKATLTGLNGSLKPKAGISWEDITDDECYNFKCDCRSSIETECESCYYIPCGWMLEALPNDVEFDSDEALIKQIPTILNIAMLRYDLITGNTDDSRVGELTLRFLDQRKIKGRVHKCAASEHWKELKRKIQEADERLEKEMDEEGYKLTYGDISVG